MYQSDIIGAESTRTHLALPRRRGDPKRGTEASMNFGFTEEQEMLRSEVRKFLDQNASMEEVRRIIRSAVSAPAA